MEGYQVTGQCMALVRDSCFVPTKDAPELGYVKESTDKQYVPDVFYKVRFKIYLLILRLFSIGMSYSCNNGHFLIQINN